MKILNMAILSMMGFVGLCTGIPVVLVTNDGIEYNLDTEAARTLPLFTHGSLINGLLEEVGQIHDKIPLPNVDSRTLNAVFDSFGEQFNIESLSIEDFLRLFEAYCYLRITPKDSYSQCFVDRVVHEINDFLQHQTYGASIIELLSWEPLKTALKNTYRRKILTYKLLPFALGQEVHFDSIDFSSNGDLCATVSILDNHRIKLWHIAETNATLLGELPTHGEISFIRFSPDSTMLLVALDDGSLELWNLRSRERVFSIASLHGFQIKSMAFSGDGRLIAAGNTNGIVYVYAAANGAQLRVFEGGHEQEALSLKFSFDGRFLCGLFNDYSCIWNVDTKNLVNFPGIGNTFFSATMHPCEHVAVVSALNNMRLLALDLDHGITQQIGTTRPNGLIFSRNGTYLATREITGEIVVYNRNGQSYTIPIEDHSIGDGTGTMNFSQDERMFVVQYISDTMGYVMQIFDPQTGRPLCIPKKDPAFNDDECAISFTSCNRFIVVNTFDMVNGKTILSPTLTLPEEECESDAIKSCEQMLVVLCILHGGIDRNSPAASYLTALFKTLPTKTQAALIFKNY